MEAYSAYTKIIKIAELVSEEHSKLEENFDKSKAEKFIDDFLSTIHRREDINIYESCIAGQYWNTIKREALFRINRANRAK